MEKQTKSAIGMGVSVLVIFFAFAWMLELMGVVHIAKKFEKPEQMIVYTESHAVDSLTAFNVKRSLEDSTAAKFKIEKLFTYKGVAVYRFNWPSMYIGSREGTFQAAETTQK